MLAWEIMIYEQDHLRQHGSRNLREEAKKDEV